MEANTPETRSSALTQAVMIWGSLIASQGMIILVSQTATPGTTASLAAGRASVPPSSLGHLNPLLFAVIGLMAAVAAIFIPKLILLTSKKSAAVVGIEPTLREISARVLPAFIIRWMLIEMIVLVGFLSSLLSAQPTAIYPFAAAGIVGFILSFPTEQKFRAALAAAASA